MAYKGWGETETTRQSIQSTGYQGWGISNEEGTKKREEERKKREEEERKQRAEEAKRKTDLEQKYRENLKTGKSSLPLFREAEMSRQQPQQQPKQAQQQEPTRDQINAERSSFFAPSSKGVTGRDIAREFPTSLGGTLKGIGTGIKDMVFPSYDYSEEELRKADPTRRQYLEGAPKMIATTSQVVPDLGNLFGKFLAEKATGKKFEDKEDKVAETLRKYWTPENAEEAKALRFANVVDIATGIGWTKKIPSKVAGKLLTEASEELSEKGLKKIATKGDAVTIGELVDSIKKVEPVKAVKVAPKERALKDIVSDAKKQSIKVKYEDIDLSDDVIETMQAVDKKKRKTWSPGMPLFGEKVDGKWVIHDGKHRFSTEFIKGEKEFNVMTDKKAYEKVLDEYEVTKNSQAKRYLKGDDGKFVGSKKLPSEPKLDPELAKTLRGAKGMTADDIVKEYPDIKLKRDVPAKDIHGNKVKIPEDEVLTPYELKGNKILLQDGETYVVNKNQFQNIKGQSISGEVKPFAPELKGTEETIKTKGGWVKGKQVPETSKYSSYQLPDGKNYKEILIKAPENETTGRAKQLTKRYKEGNISLEKYKEELKYADTGSSNFQSSHWDEPNVVSHLRMNERTYKGKKVSFMEELQSDWAREVRERGKQTEFDLGNADDYSPVPKHPLLKNWQEPTIKRALKEAVDSDAKYFSWINGEQTSARYNLSSQVDNIGWARHAESKQKLVTISPTGGNNIGFLVDDTGKVTKGMYGKSDSFVGKKVDEVLGKGLADKLMSKMSGDLSGDGLKFGGEWAGNLYDKQVKNIVEDLTGGKVQKMDLGLPVGKADKKFNLTKTPGNVLTSKELTPKTISVGAEIVDTKRSFYIITDVLGDGKFKAAEKDFHDSMKGRWLDMEKDKNWLDRVNKNAETFDISTKKATQQGIELTPEIIAKIKGEAPAFKASGKKFATKKQPTKTFVKKLPNEEAFGAVAGIEKDEEGNLKFDPTKAAIGVAGVAGVTKGKKIIKPAIKTFDSIKPTKLKTTISKLAKKKEGLVAEELAIRAQKMSDEMEDQYSVFKSVLSPAKLDKIGDASQLRNALGEKADDILWSQNKTDDEMFSLFKERRFKELSERGRLGELKKEQVKVGKKLAVLNKEDKLKTVAEKRLATQKATFVKKEEKLVHSLQKVNRRREQVSGIKGYFGLSDSAMRKAGGKQDVKFMTDFEYKTFKDNLLVRAEKEAVRIQKLNEVTTLISQKELKKTGNLRKAMGFPTMDKMTTNDLTSFNKALEETKHGDEFLGVRKMETLNNTDLAGVKTKREVAEVLAKKAGVPVEELSTIKTTPTDYARYETALAEKNPLFKVMVDEKNMSMMGSRARFLKEEKTINDLVSKARKSRRRTIVDRLIPQDDKIFKYLESPNKAQFAKTMTKEELKASKHIESIYGEMRDYLVQHKTLSNFRENYVTHIRKGLLESIKDDGMFKAVKNIFKQQKEDAAVFNILSGETGEVLAFEKFFKYSLRRSGELEPSKNVAKAVNTYIETFEKKRGLDAIVPMLDSFVDVATPAQKTPGGMVYDASLKKFSKTWLNMQKGRKFDYGGLVKQGEKMDVVLRGLKSLTSVIDLGFAVPIGIATKGGENITNFTMLGTKKYLKGLARTQTKQGKKILSQHRNFIGKNPWAELAEASKDIGDKIGEAAFVLFNDAQVGANKTFLMGSLTKEEFKSGVITTKRLADLRRDMGRFRVVDDAKSILGNTSPGGIVTQYKTWAIPIIRTSVKDLKTVLSMAKEGKLAKKEASELVRGTIATATIALATYGVVSSDQKESEKTFAKKTTDKIVRDTMSLFGAFNPDMWAGEFRSLQFVRNIVSSMEQIVKLEEYETDGKEYVEGELKGPAKLKRLVTPGIAKQFKDDSQKELTKKKELLLAGELIPTKEKTKTGREVIKFKKKPGFVETIIGKAKGEKVSNIPEEEWAGLVEKKQEETKKEIERTKVKDSVMETGKPEEFDGKIIHIKDGILTTSTERSFRMKPILEKYDNLLKDGKKAEAQKLKDDLSKKEWEDFEAVRSSWRSSNTSKLRKYLAEDSKEAVEFVESQNPKEEQRLKDVLSKDEWKKYKELRK
jgi:hypothetical protein